ncbi:MAG: transketolase [Bacillus thermozeamaize]|uniref:Transketolase n=1 Tax=Bacillus thermozeamaize TaxID=230954 RepID=A0A1Y3PTN1_9BACI|nr:MAG: transketolase [Bacillus thermozeamaize]
MMETASKGPYADLEEVARLIRKNVLDMVRSANAGHVGGAYSAAEMFAALYFRIMNIDPSRPDWEDRDRFILSKGHCAIGLYVCLAYRGYFDPSLLTTFDHIGSILQAHPDMTKTPGIDMSTGSLGQGLSAALGQAAGLKLLGKTCQVYCMIGDGECQEGQIWEAAMAAPKMKLDNLTVFLDYNRLQLAGKVDDFMPLEPLAEKWQAFGWYVLEIDGHNFDQILAAAEEAKSVKGKPTIIIAHTVKGKGVSFMEHNVAWHSKVPTPEEYEVAMRELGFA